MARHDHRRIGKPRLSWNDLRHERFILRERGSETSSYLEHLLEAQRLHICSNIELQGNETIKHAIMAGMGISFLAAQVFQTELKAGKFAILTVEGMPKWLDWCVGTRIERSVPLIRKSLRDFVINTWGPVCFLYALNQNP